jgi:hypothetical protein
MIAPLGVIKGAPLAYEDPDRNYDALRAEERIPFFPYKHKGEREQLAWTYEGYVHHEYQALPAIRAQTIESFACAHRPQYIQRGGARGRIEFWRHLNPNWSPELQIHAPIGEARLHGTGASGVLHTSASEHDKREGEASSVARGTIKRSPALLHSTQRGNISAADARAALVDIEASSKRAKEHAAKI